MRFNRFPRDPCKPRSHPMRIGINPMFTTKMKYNIHRMPITNPYKTHYNSNSKALRSIIRIKIKWWPCTFPRTIRLPARSFPCPLRTYTPSPRITARSIKNASTIYMPSSNRFAFRTPTSARTTKTCKFSNKSVKSTNPVASNTIKNSASRGLTFVCRRRRRRRYKISNFNWKSTLPFM